MKFSPNLISFEAQYFANYPQDFSVFFTESLQDSNLPHLRVWFRSDKCLIVSFAREARKLRWIGLFRRYLIILQVVHFYIQRSKSLEFYIGSTRRLFHCMLKFSSVRKFFENFLLKIEPILGISIFCQIVTYSLHFCIGITRGLQCIRYWTLVTV